MILVLALVACGGGSPPVVHLDVTASGTAPASFTEDDGTAITLTSGSAAFSDLRMEEPPEEDARIAWPSLFPVAYAHPGHDFSGDVEGELLGDFTVDLLADPVDLGEASLYVGPYATARLKLASVTLEGTVTPTGGEATPFAFTVPFTDHEITGMAFEATVDEDETGTLALGIDAAWMLSFQDWTTLAGDDATLTLADGNLGNSVPFGITSTPAWTLSLEE